MRLGTPLEDALRRFIQLVYYSSNHLLLMNIVIVCVHFFSGRDFTINALFYNINEDKVEDFTERGLDDLKKCLNLT